MWDRRELKEKGKAAFKANYWQCVLVAFIISVVSAAGGSGGRAGSGQNGDSSANLMNNIQNLDSFTWAVVGTVIAVALVIYLLMAFFITNPLTIGATRFFIKNSDDSSARVNEIVSPYREGRLVKIFVTMFLKGLYTFLWSLLFVIPGIIKGYSYRMVPYILAEEPELSGNEVINRSKEMMNGHKMNAFLLDLSFIGWIILTFITCGILGVFYTSPYIMATNAELYLAIKSANKY